MSKGLRQKERCRWAPGSGVRGSDGPWPSVKEGVCYLPGVGRPRCLLARWVLRGHTPRGGGQALGQPVCKLDPGRAGGPIALLCGGNKG